MERCRQQRYVPRGFLAAEAHATPADGEGICATMKRCCYLVFLVSILGGCSSFSATVVKLESDSGTNDVGGSASTGGTGFALTGGSTQMQSAIAGGSANQIASSGGSGDSSSGGVSSILTVSSSGGTTAMVSTNLAGMSSTLGSGGTSTCTVGSYAYATGTKDPNNECMSCQPNISTAAWAPVADGTFCGLNSGMICRTGVCKIGCIVGSSYYDTGTVNPANPCLTCQSSKSTNRWSDVPSARCVQAISAGGLHTCAIVNGAALCWGANPDGELGNNATTSSLLPVQVQGLTQGVAVIAASDTHSCAVVNGAAVCWGSNQSGELGNNSTLGSLVPVQVQNLTENVLTISARDSGTCALLGSVYALCWGSRYLGDNTTNSSLIPVRVQGIGGISSSLAITSLVTGDTQSACAIVNGSAQCWGSGNQGALGN